MNDVSGFRPRHQNESQGKREQEGPKTPKPVTKSSKTPNQQEKDSSGLARIRRDWSTLFRREKKPSAAEPNSPSTEPKLAKSDPVSDSRDVDVQADHSTISDSSRAICHGESQRLACISRVVLDPVVSVDTRVRGPGGERS